MGKLPELAKLVEDKDVHLLLLQETWLDASIPFVSLPNFQVISRRDRSAGPSREGILALARNDIKNIWFLKDGSEAERFWLVVQQDTTEPKSETSAACMASGSW